MTLRAVIFSFSIASSLWTTACAAQVGVRTATGGTARQCDDPAVLASIEVLPIGLAPPRRFRSLGVVEANWDVSSQGRVRTLQTRACELGADGIIGWSERGVGGGLAQGFVNGGTILLQGGGGHVVASGVAIVYTDGPRDAEPPVLARASDGGAPVVVDVQR